MKTLNNFIIEKLKITKDTKIQLNNFTDEELREDYKTVDYAIYKAEKKEIADKYNVSSIKIRDIQLAILEELRKNRHNKKEYDTEDVWDFFKFDIPDGNYNKFVKWLEQEPEDFIEFMLKFYKDKNKSIYPKYKGIAYPPISFSDRRQLRLIQNFQKYLGHE